MHESAIGPKQTWAIALHMSAFGSKADIFEGKAGHHEGRLKFEDATRPNTFFSSDMLKCQPCQLVRACDSCYPDSAALLANRWKTIGKRSHIWPFAWAAEFSGNFNMAQVRHAKSLTF
jgi:hypothetical protein